MPRWRDIIKIQIDLVLHACVYKMHPFFFTLHHPVRYCADCCTICIPERFILFIFLHSNMFAICVYLMLGVFFVHFYWFPLFFFLGGLLLIWTRCVSQQCQLFDVAQNVVSTTLIFLMVLLFPFSVVVMIER